MPKPLRVLRTNSTWDPILATATQRPRIIESFDRIVSYNPYAFNSGLVGWAPPTWIYFNLHDGQAGPRLVDSDSAPLYVPWPNSSGPTYSRTTADISSSTYRSGWIAEAIAMLDAGAKGFWIDDVNVDVDRSAVRQGGPAPTRDMTWWPMQVASFVEEITTALKAHDPDCEILHNSVWFAGRPNRWLPPIAITKLKEWSFDATVESWVSTDGTVSRQTDTPHSGTGYLRAVTSGTYYGQGPSCPQEAVTPAAEYTWSGWVRIPTGEAVYPKTHHFDALGGSFIKSDTHDVLWGNDGWQRITRSFTADAAAHAVIFQIAADSAAIRTIDVEDVTIVEGGVALDYGEEATGDPSAVRRQMAAADYINIEGGFTDGGLTAGAAEIVASTGDEWSLRSLLAYISAIHDSGAKFIVEHWDTDEGKCDYALAVWLSCATAGDGIGLQAEVDRWPLTWWKWGIDWGSRTSVVDAGATSTITTALARGDAVVTPGTSTSAHVGEKAGRWTAGAPLA